MDEHQEISEWNKEDFLQHVAVGRAVLEQYFKVVDELHRRQREVGILSSELDFMIHFIERLLSEEDNGTLRVVLARLRATVITVRSNPSH